MKANRQRRTACLLVLLLLVGIPCLFVWRERRRLQLSARLIAAIKQIQELEDSPDDADGDNPKVLGPKETQEKVRRGEALALRLIQEGADPNTRDFAVVKRTFWQDVRFLLEQTFGRRSGSKSLPPSALALAVQADNASIVKALLKAGANDVDAVLEYAESGAHFALVNYGVYEGNLEIVQGLCDHRAKLTQGSVDFSGQSLGLLLTTLQGDPGYRYGRYRHQVTEFAKRREREQRTEIFHLLLSKGVRYIPHSEEGYSLLCAAAEHAFAELVQEMLAAGVPPKAPSRWIGSPADCSPLDYAVMNDDIPLVKLLLQHGASARDIRLEEPMAFAESPEMADLLLKHGADPHAERRAGHYSGENALNLACVAGNARMVAYLIAHGFVINRGDADDDRSPIDEAAEYADAKTVRLLLQHGAKVGPCSPGANALWLAIAESHFDSAKLLLAHGADVNTGIDPPLLAAAQQDDSVEIVRELLAHGADANVGNGAALFYACESCDEDLVELLLEHGANPNGYRANGKTAMQIAVRNAITPSDVDGIVALLKQYGAKQ